MKHIIFLSLIICNLTNGMSFHGFGNYSPEVDRLPLNDGPPSDDELIPEECVPILDQGEAGIDSNKLLGCLENLKSPQICRIFARRINSPKYASWKDRNGNTLLHYLFALMTHEGYREPIITLIEQGADINAQNCAGQTPLHFLRYWDFAKHVIEEYGAQLAIQDAEGKTALEAIFPVFTRFIGHEDLAQFSDWPVDAYDTGGYTILHRICMTHANWRNAYHFLKCGANPNARTRNAQNATALHLAAKYNGDQESRWAPLCSGLLEFGADSALRDGNGNTPFDIMMHQSRHQALLKHAKHGDIGDESSGARFLLKSCGVKLVAAKKEALRTAARNGHIEFMHLMLDHGAQVSGSAYARNPLHDLAQWEIKPYKTQRSSTFPPKKFENSECLEAMRKEKYFAPIRKKATDIVTRLITAGVCVNAQSRPGHETPLHEAVKQSNMVMTQVLLEQGANPNILDADFKTPLDLTSLGNDEIIELLLSHGARLDCGSEELKELAWAMIEINLRDAVKANNHEAITRMLEQGGYRILHELDFYEEDDISKDTITVLLTHPLTGPAFEDKQMPKIRESWFAFLCAFKQMQQTTRIFVPRDIRRILARLILPPVSECIEQVPTKELHRYAPVYGKGALVHALVERHKEMLKNQAELARKQTSLKPEGLIEPLEVEDFDTDLKPIIAHKYEKLLLPI